LKGHLGVLAVMPRLPTLIGPDPDLPPVLSPSSQSLIFPSFTASNSANLNTNRTLGRPPFNTRRIDA
jgi:hypothetical protein